MRLTRLLLLCALVPGCVLPSRSHENVQREFIDAERSFGLIDDVGYVDYTRDGEGRLGMKWGAVFVLQYFRDLMR